jgi:hypothetical protein
MNDLIAANLYHLQGGGIHVTYASTSFTGQPQLTYQDASGTKNFSGDQLTTVETPIGNLVTVTTHMTVDTGSITFSVLIPTVNLNATGHSAPVHTDGVTTVHRFGPLPVSKLGQIQVYTFVALHGSATHVVA